LGSLFKNLKIVDEFFEIEKGNRDTYKKQIQKISKIEFQNIYCPHQSVRSALLALQLKAKIKTGFSSWWNSFIFNQTIKKDMNLPDSLRQLSLLSFQSAELKTKIENYSKQFNIQSLEPVPEWASLDISDRVSLKEKTNFQKPYICLFPGSVWATKQWTIEGYTELAKQLDRLGFKVVLMGGKDEFHLGEHICKHVVAAQNLIGQTDLLETLSILKASAGIISNDSAGQHLASAVNVPQVSIFGPTVLSLGFRPWSNKAKVVEVQNLSCRPCGKHGHQTCPIKTHACMKNISANQVLAAAEQIIRRP